MLRRSYTTPNEGARGFGSRKRLWRANSPFQRPQTAPHTSPKTAHVQASLEMARLGIEPRTARFQTAVRIPGLLLICRPFFGSGLRPHATRLQGSVGDCGTGRGCEHQLSEEHRWVRSARPRPPGVRPGPTVPG